MGKDLTQEQETALELLIDSNGLCAILQSLSSIYDQKGEHILSTYQDHALAKAWARAGETIGIASCYKAITAVGEP